MSLLHLGILLIVIGIIVALLLSWGLGVLLFVAGLVILLISVFSGRRVQ